jgi:hypothetical protein
MDLEAYSCESVFIYILIAIEDGVYAALRG